MIKISPKSILTSEQKKQQAIDIETRKAESELFTSRGSIPLGPAALPPGAAPRKPTSQADSLATVVRIARQAAPEAMQRMVALVNSRDPRIALAASQAVVERAVGKTREYQKKELTTSERKIDIKAVMANASDQELKTIKAMFQRMAEQQQQMDEEDAAFANDPTNDPIDEQQPADEAQPAGEVDHPHVGTTPASPDGVDIVPDDMATPVDDV